MLANDLFEETAPGERTIEDLGESELRLQDRELIPIPRRAVRGGKGMGQSSEPFVRGVNYFRPRVASAENATSDDGLIVRGIEHRIEIVCPIRFDGLVSYG